MLVAGPVSRYIADARGKRPGNGDARAENGQPQDDGRAHRVALRDGVRRHGFPGGGALLHGAGLRRIHDGHVGAQHGARQRQIAPARPNQGRQQKQQVQQVQPHQRAPANAQHLKEELSAIGGQVFGVIVPLPGLSVIKRIEKIAKHANPSFPREYDIVYHRRRQMSLAFEKRGGCRACHALFSRTSAAYAPFMASSSRCVPCSIIRPEAMT